jgi:hypothetical protein
MITKSPGELSYYASQGAITNPGTNSGLFDQLPSDISQLCSIIQGLLLHQHWAKRYGETLSAARTVEASIRHVEFILEKIQEIDQGSLLEPRQLSKRFIGNCRTYSVLLASILRSQGVPARARCGFGRYFLPGHYEDHWVCEYWLAEESKWIMVDAQLDEYQRQVLDIQFDPLDVPRDQFIVAGNAWLSCRNGESDPKKYGIFDMHGLWFIRGNLIRDIAALNKVELLPWDGWGLIDRDDDSLTAAELGILDNIASLTSDEVEFQSVREVYVSEQGTQVPPVIHSYTQSGRLEVDLSLEEVIN